MKKLSLLFLLALLLLSISSTVKLSASNSFEGGDGGGIPQDYTETRIIQKSNGSKCVEWNNFWFIETTCKDRHYYTEEVYHYGNDPIIEPLFHKEYLSTFTAASTLTLSESVTAGWSVGFGISTSSSSGINLETPGVSASMSYGLETTIEGTYHTHTTVSASLIYERPDRISSGNSWNIALYSFNEKAKLYDVTYDLIDPYRAIIENDFVGYFYITQLTTEWAITTEDAYKTSSWMDQVFSATLIAVENNSKD